MLRTFLGSLRHALRGLKTVAREERNFRIQLLCAIVVIAFALLTELDATAVALLVIVAVLVLMMEVVNTFVEDLLNIIEPERHPMVGKLKDMIAGAVLIVSLGAIGVGALVFFGLQMQ